MSIRKCFPVETVPVGRVAPFGAAPGWEQAEDCPEDLSFQSFTQHGTLILPRCNTDFVFSVFSSASGQKPNRFLPECLAAIATRGPDRGGESGERNPKQTAPRCCAGMQTGRACPSGGPLHPEWGHPAPQDDLRCVRSDCGCCGHCAGGTRSATAAVRCPYWSSAGPNHRRGLCSLAGRFATAPPGPDRH